MVAVPRSEAGSGAYLDSIEHVFDELRRIDLLLTAAVGFSREQARNDVPAELRGLVIGESEIDALLARPGLIAQRWARRDGLPAAVQALRAADAHRARIDRRRQAGAAQGVRLALVELARQFELAPAEVDALLIALAPEIDPVYETLYAYLHNDVTRKRPSVGLVLDLICRSAGECLLARRMFDPGARLLARRLIEMGDEPGTRSAPLLSRWLKLDDTLVAWLLTARPLAAAAGARLIDSAATAWNEELSAAARERVEALARELALAGDRGLVVQLEGRDEAALRGAAAVFARSCRRRLLLANDCPPEKLVERLGILQRDAVLSNALLAVKLAAGADASVWHALAELGGLVLVLNPGAAAGELPGDVRVWRLSIDAPDFDIRRESWQAAAQAHAAQWDAAWLADTLPFGGRRIGQAIDLAAGIAATCAQPADTLSMEHLLCAGRMMTSPQLGPLALRIEPRYTWSDLVLPAEKTSQLRQAAAWLKCRRTVHRDWGFGAKLSRGKGLVLLFTGPSGTGKTMAAEVLAGELGLELFQIDLSNVVSKYIGETEKNLSSIFGDAERSQAVLFFDEADALFGKRTEVKDAHDRYANIEVNYLLQRVEQYSGIVILATNLQSNVDEAFLRRMKQVVEFPFPDEAMREAIWRNHLPPAAPRADDIDLGFMARQFKLTGGSIRNIVLNAAFAAASDTAAISMRHLILAVRNELQKEGKLCIRSDFGPYYELVQAPRGA